MDKLLDHKLLKNHKPKGGRDLELEGKSSKLSGRDEDEQKV